MSIASSQRDPAIEIRNGSPAGPSELDSRFSYFYMNDLGLTVAQFFVLWFPPGKMRIVIVSSVI